MSSVPLDGLAVYRKAMELGDLVWSIVRSWPYFLKDTLGKQWLRSVDSIAANIAEGYGRHFYKENRLFCYYSRGSLQESICWLEKANQRKLLSSDQYRLLLSESHFLSYTLNKYIKSIGKNDRPHDRT